jgi:hypothetical protein
MATVSTDLWADELTVMLPGATKAAIQLALRATFREFCLQSGAWVRELPLIDLDEGVSTYELAPYVADAEILYILAVMWRAESSPEAYYRALRGLQVPNNRGRRVTVSEAPVAYYGNTEQPSRITVDPTPSKDLPQSLLVYAALGPKYPYEDTMPAFFRSHLFDVILDGTAGRMMGQQDKPYTNTIGAQYYMRRFRTGMAQARDMARRQFTSAETGFRFPSWAR